MAAQAKAATTREALERKSDECGQAITELNLKEQALASVLAQKEKSDLEIERLRKLLADAESRADASATGLSGQNADIDALKEALKAERDAREKLSLIHI